MGFIEKNIANGVAGLDANTKIPVSLLPDSQQSNGVSGALQFSDGSGGFISDNANLHWNNTGKTLGIGIANPLETLHLDSTGSTILRIDGNTSASMLLRDSGATLDEKMFIISSNDGQLSITPLNDNGSEKSNPIIFTSSGDVGIGTTPGVDLHVSRTGVSAIITTQTTGPPGTFASFGCGSVSSYIGFDSTSPRFSIGPSTGLTIVPDFSKSLHITSAGDVGVGISVPLGNLHVASTTEASIEIEGTVGGGVEQYRFGLLVNPGFAPRALSFYDRNADTSRMLIDRFGNVGIGTITPGAKLDIAGNVKITDGTQGAGKVFTSDATGLGTWATAVASASGADGAVQFATTGNLNSDIDNFLWDDSNNRLGIANGLGNTPQYRLDVGDASYFAINGNFAHTIQHNSAATTFWSIAPRNGGDLDIAVTTTDPRPTSGTIGTSGNAISIKTNKDVDFLGNVNLSNNTLSNVGAAGNNWTQNALTLAGGTSSQVLTINTTGLGIGNVSELLLVTPESSTATSGSRVTFREGDGSGSANNMEYLLAYNASDNRMRFLSRDANGSSQDLDIWRIPDGQTSIDANTTWDDNAFDKYDDVALIAASISPTAQSYDFGKGVMKRGREALIEVGILNKYDDDWVGYNDQRMAALLAGGIYQTRHKVDENQRDIILLKAQITKLIAQQ